MAKFTMLVPMDEIVRDKDDDLLAEAEKVDEDISIHRWEASDLSDAYAL